jgi:hypothetical protein
MRCTRAFIEGPMFKDLWKLNHLDAPPDRTISR